MDFCFAHQIQGFQVYWRVPLSAHLFSSCWVGGRNHSIAGAGHCIYLVYCTLHSKLAIRLTLSLVGGPYNHFTVCKIPAPDVKGIVK